MTYSALEQRFKELGNLRHAQAMLNWDEAVMMPSGGGSIRAESMATLAAMAHRMITAAETAQFIEAAAEQDELSPWQRANLREITTIWRDANALPESLVIARSRASSLCEQAWRVADVPTDPYTRQYGQGTKRNQTRLLTRCAGPTPGHRKPDPLVGSKHTKIESIGQGESK